MILRNLSISNHILKVLQTVKEKCHNHIKHKLLKKIGENYYSESFKIKFQEGVISSS